MTTETAPPPPPPPSAGGAPQPPRLTRRRDDRLIGGVAGGLADHFNLDPVLVRIAFVLLALFGGSGIVLYLALWFLVPERDSGEVLAGSATRWAQDSSERLGTNRTAGFWIGVGLIAIAAVSLLDNLIDGGVLFALLLIGVGVALFRSDTSGTAAPQGGVPMAGDPTTAPTSTAPTGMADLDEVITPRPASAAPPSAPAVPVAPPPPPRPSRERSILGRMTLGLAVLWVGVAAMVDELSRDIDFTAAGVIGVAMAILGLGLLVGSVLGRARWLVVIAILLTPLLLAASLLDHIDVPFGAGVGTRNLVVDAGSPSVVEELFAGEVGIVVADVSTGPAGVDVRRDVRVRLGAGDLRVAVPDGWTIVLKAHVGIGEIVEPSRGNGYDGFDQSVDATIAGDPDRPTVHLDLDVGVGQIRVSRIRATRAANDLIPEVTS